MAERARRHPEQPLEDQETDLLRQAVMTRFMAHYPHPPASVPEVLRFGAATRSGNGFARFIDNAMLRFAEYYRCFYCAEAAREHDKLDADAEQQCQTSAKGSATKTAKKDRKYAELDDLILRVAAELKPPYKFPFPPGQRKSSLAGHVESKASYKTTVIKARINHIDAEAKRAGEAG